MGRCPFLHSSNCIPDLRYVLLYTVMLVLTQVLMDKMPFEDTCKYAYTSVHIHTYKNN